MASWLRYGRRAARLVSLLGGAQGSLGHELEIHGPGNGGVEKRIKVLGNPTVREHWNGDATRERSARGQGVPRRRRAVMAMTSQYRMDGLSRPAVGAHI